MAGPLAQPLLSKQPTYWGGVAQRPLTPGPPTPPPPVPKGPQGPDLWAHYRHLYVCTEEYPRISILTFRMFYSWGWSNISHSDEHA
eukprot:9376610-Heterocapsa_arctica.AAC.1